MRRVARLLALLLTIGWSGGFALAAWRAEVQAQFWTTAGPVFLPASMPDYIAQVRRSTDWQTPLMLAALPLALFLSWRLLRLLEKRRAG